MATTRITARVKAARERVFRAFTDPADVQRWMVPPGMTSIVHAFDARVGGRFRVSLSYTEIEATHEGLPPALSPADNELGWRQSRAKLAAMLE